MALELPCEKAPLFFQIAVVLERSSRNPHAQSASEVVPVPMESPLLNALLDVPNPVTPPLLSEKTERSSHRPGMPNLHLKSGLCQ